MADEPKKSGIPWIVGVVIAASALMRLCNPSSHSTYSPPSHRDFQVPDFQDAERLRKSLESLSRPPPTDFLRGLGDKSPWHLLPKVVALQPMLESEPGVDVVVDGSGPEPLLQVVNRTEPHGFLGKVTLRLSCTGTVDQTLAVGNLRPGQFVSAAWPHVGGALDILVQGLAPCPGASSGGQS